MTTLYIVYIVLSLFTGMLMFTPTPLGVCGGCDCAQYTTVAQLSDG